MIKFHAKELIENTESENIELKKIGGPCKVLKGKEYDSVSNILESYKNGNSMAYVCRYKLVKKTSYKLVPVDWSPGEDEMYDTDLNTDTEDQSEAMRSLSSHIDELHLSLTSEDNDIKTKSVTPIKILNKSKVIRSYDNTKTSPSNKRASPDNAHDSYDVSPSKRNKLIDTPRLESPATRNGKYVSPTQKKMESIRKNLNSSFGAEDHLSPYEMQKKSDTKIVIKKKGVLTEQNSNEPQTPRLRRSILVKDSAKSK